MKTGKSLSIFTLLFLSIAIIFPACGGGGGGSGSGGDSDNGGGVFKKVTIGPQGGDFNLSNGINLSIPPDAVPEETTFQFRVIPETEILLPGNIFKTHDIRYLAGFEAMPYGYMFNKPISISIPSAGLPDSTSLPYPMFMDIVTKEFFPISELDTITTDIKNLQRYSFVPSEPKPAPPGYHFGLSKIHVRCDGKLVMPDLSALPLDQLGLAMLAIDKVLRESDCVRDPCRCCDFEVLSDDFDSASNTNDGCYSVYSNGYVKYLACEGQQTEMWSLEESNLDVTVNPGSAKIEVDEITKHSISLSNDSGEPVTNFSIINVTVDDASVITTLSYDDSSVWFQGLSPGTANAEITIAAGDCQYKAWLTVNVGEIGFVTDKITVIVTEGCRNTFQVKLDIEPPSPVNATISYKGGDPDISVENGSSLSFNESNWYIYQPVTLYAGWDEDDVNGKTQIEIIGKMTGENDLDVGGKLVTAEEYDVSKLELAINGSASKFNEGPIVELHDELSGTVTLDNRQGVVSGHGILDYEGEGHGLLYLGDGQYQKCDYTIVGTGVVDIEGFTTCLENDFTLSVWFELYTDYLFYNSCEDDVTHNFDEYGESDLVNLSTLNDYIYEETDEYDSDGAHYIESMRIKLLQPPSQ